MLRVLNIIMINKFLLFVLVFTFFWRFFHGSGSGLGFFGRSGSGQKDPDPKRWDFVRAAEQFFYPTGGFIAGSDSDK